MNNFTPISVEQAAALLKPETRIIDIRDTDSFAQGHLPGAQHFDRQALFDLMEEGPKDQPHLIYCYKGNASQTAAQLLAEEGFINVYSLVGGFNQWAEQHPELIETHAIK